MSINYTFNKQFYLTSFYTLGHYKCIGKHETHCIWYYKND